MEAEAGENVDGEKGGEVEKKEEDVVDATGVTSMLLRVSGQPRVVVGGTVKRHKSCRRFAESEGRGTQTPHRRGGKLCRRTRRCFRLNMSGQGHEETASSLP